MSSIRLVAVKILFSALLFSLVISAKSQTALAPGDIVFTGYTSSFGGGGTDNFSFVLLKAITQNTIIKFTNEGYTIATNTFQCQEETLTYTCTLAGGLAAGKEITITGTTATLSATSGGGSAGTCTLTGTDPLGLNLATSGDQVIAYQGTITCPGGTISGGTVFISAIHMNVYSSTTNGDCGNTTAATWDPSCASGSGNYCQIPPGLTTGVNCFWEGVFDDFSTEHDDGKFNGCGLDLSTPAAVRTAVLNRANWIFGDAGTSTISLPSNCTYLAAAPCSVALTSAAGTNAQTKCINTAITNITYSTTGATGATFSGLPSGVTGNWAANVVTISGSPTASGVFNYTVTSTGGTCTPANTATGSITVTPNNTITLTSAAGTNSQTVPVNSAITNITYSTTGATGATFSGLPSGVTGNWAANVVTISGSPTATGTFNYTVTLTGGCGLVTATGSITVNPAACSIVLSSAAGTDAQTVCINTAITNITYTTTSATGATFSGLPAGVTGAWAANVVTISGTPTVTGTFNYTVTLTGGVCTVTTATGSITVTPNNTVTLTSAAGTDAQTVTLTAPITNITYSTTGATGATFSGLPAGVTGNWAANVVTISGTPTATGVFNYTVTLTGGCGLITATGSITVNPSGPPTTLAAGDIAFTGYHSGTALIDSFSFVLLKPINAGTIINFTDNGWLNPGVFRTGEEVATFTSIALPAGAEIVIGGPAGLTARWYNYNCGGGIISAGTVTGTALNLTTGGDQIIAYQGTLAAPTSLISMIHMNTYSTVNLDCGNTTAAGLDPDCIDGGTGTIGNGSFSKLPPGLIIGTNALWIGDASVPSPAGEYDNAKFNGCGLNLSTPALARAAINNQANWLVDNLTPPGFTLPAGCNFLNLCPSACSITLTSAVGTDAQTKCINTAITNITYATTSATGATFSGLPAGVTGAWAANVVTISGTPTAAGTFNYTVTLTGGACTSGNTATGSITVTAANTITLTSAAGTDAQTVNVNTAITNITYATTGATGATFSGLPSGVTGSWAANVATISGSPTATGTFNYTVTLTGGCGVVTATGSITVNPAACSIILSSAAGTTSQTVCINTAITNITYTTTGATGATFSGLPAGVTGAWAANVVTISGTPTASGVFNYTITLTGGPCTVENTTGSITVTPNNTVTLTSAAGTDAQTVTLTAPITNITYSTTGATGATFSGLPAGVTGNWAANVVTISGTPTATGVFNYTVTLTGGCGLITATGSITVNPSGPPTTLAAGDIAFTGYHSGTALIDSFSFVLLKPINAGTIINFTDNGWLNPGVFRTGEEVATFTSIALPAGAEIVIGGPAGLTARWYNYNCGGGIISAGTVTGTALNLTTGGDQIIAFQGTLAAPTSLISMIHMNTYSTVNGDCGNTTAAGLDPDCIDGGTGTIGNGSFSKLPPGLIIGTNALWIGDASLASPAGEYDNAKFNGCGLNLTTPALARAAINNQANWLVDNLTPPGFTLPAGCNFLNLCPVPCSLILTSAAGTDAQTVCVNTAITNITYNTTTATGATFSGLPAGVTGAWAANVVTISGTPTVTGTFNYTVTLTGGACSTTANGSITVNPLNTITLTSAAGTDNQSVLINTAITNITYSTTGATGATFSGLPTGVNGTWAANVVTISGTPSVGGTFNYTVTLTGGCGLVTATGTITVTVCSITLTSAAGTNTQSVCFTTPITNITYSTTGATGATFSGLPAGVTGAWAANVVTISGSPTQFGTFNYTVTPTGGGCSGAVTATGTITINPDTWLGGTSTNWFTTANWSCGVPTATTDVTIPSGTPNSPLITGGTAQVHNIMIQTGAVLTNNGTLNINGGGAVTNNGMYKGTGAFTGALFDNSGGVVAPGNSPGCTSFGAGYTNGSGTENIEIGGTTPCTQYDQIQVTGTATLSGTLNVILFGGYVPSCGESYKIMTSTTLVGTFASTIFPALPAGLSWGIAYNSPNPGDVTLNIVGTPTATATPSAQTICSGSAITTIVLNGSPIAGTVYNWTRDNLAAATGIVASGTGNISGNLTNATTSPVTVTFTITPTSGSCVGTPITATVIVDPTPDVTQPADQTVCNGAPTAPVNFTGSVAGTTFNWTNNNTSIGLAASGSGNIASFTGTNATNAPITGAITVTPSAGTGGGGGNVFTNPGFESGAFAPGWVVMTAAPAPTVDNVAPRTGIFAMHVGSLPGGETPGDCAVYQQITVPAGGGILSYWYKPRTVDSITFDWQDAYVTNLSGTVLATIMHVCSNVNVYTNVTFNLAAFAGQTVRIEFLVHGDNAGDPTDMYVDDVSLNGAPIPCTGAPKTFNITVNPTATVNAVANQIVCSGATQPAILFSSPTTGGSIIYNWTNNTPSIGLAASGSGDIPAFTATNATTVPVVATVTVTPAYTNNGVTCNGTPMTFTITVNPTPTATATPSSQTICSASPITTIVLSGNAVAGVVYNWTRDNNGTVTGIAASGSGNISGTLTNTTNVPVTVTFTITPTANGCAGTPITATVLVNPTPNAVATPGAQTVCSGSAITTIVLSGNVAGTVYNWTRDNNVNVTGIAASGAGNISGTLTNITTSEQTVTFTITPTANGCPGTPITAIVLVNPTPDVAQPANQTLCNNTATAPVNFSGTVPGTIFNWTNNTPSIGLAASGTGNIASFNATNASNVNVVATITVTPTYTNAPVVVPFNFTGAMQTFTVPAGVFSVNIQAFGAQGGNGVVGGSGASGGTGGLGASATGTLAVVPGQVLNIFVGGSGTAPTGGFNGGGDGGSQNAGGGGGASDVRVGGVTPANRVITAGGGGGGGRGGCIEVGAGLTPGNGGVGGIGGGGVGSSGGNSTQAGFGPAGGGFPGNSGSIQGAFGSKGIGCAGFTGSDGASTANEVGGVGGAGQNCCCPAGNSIVGGGGGGGGQLGGGGGGGGSAGTTSCEGNSKGAGGGGGGGSNYIGGVTSGSSSNGVQTGNGQVVITFVTAPAVTCSGAPKTFTITVKPTPNAVANPSSQTRCSGVAIQTIAITGNVAGTVYNWTRDNTVAVTGIAASGAGDISGTLTNTTTAPVTVTFTITPTANGCAGTPITATVLVNPTPTVSAAPSSQTVCSAVPITTIVLTGNGVAGAVNNWTRDNVATVTGIAASGSGNISGTLTNLTNSPITVTFTITPTANGCNGPVITATVLVNPTPNAVATPSSQTICNNLAITTIVINGNVAGTVFNWTRDNTVAVTGIAASGSGNISGTLNNTTNAPVTVTFTITPTANGCAGTPVTATVTVNPTPTATATPSSQTICSANPITTIVLSGSPVAGTVYNWTRDNVATVTGIAASGAGNISGTLTNTTNIPITVTFTITPAANGCNGPSITATVLVNPTPTATATPSTQTICTGSTTQQIVFTGTVAGTTYAWTRDNNATVTGLPASGSGNVPAATLTNLTNAPVTVTFTITPTANGCSGPAITATIVVNPIPNAVATPSSQTICSGSAITTIALTGNVVGTVYNWTRDNVATVTGIAASGTGNIAGSLTNTTFAPITVTFTITPSFTNAGVTCTGPTITATVTVNPIPNAVATPSSQSACSGVPITTIVLTGNVAGTVYNWTRDNTVLVTGIPASGTGNISGTLTQNSPIPITVTFTITPTYTNAGVTCTGPTITATVIVNPTPNAVATPSSQTVCSGIPITTIVLSGSVAGTVYNWVRDNNATVTGIAASGSGNISGTLTNTTNAPVTVTFTITPTANGCTGPSITATVLVNPTPNAVATPSSQTICSGNPITTIVLTGNVAGTTFTWTRDNTVNVTGIPGAGGGNTIAGTLTNNTNVPQLVTFTITPMANGCTGPTTTATVLVNPTPHAVATPSAQTVCSGTPIIPIVLTSDVAGTTYTWTRDNTVNVTGIAASGSGSPISGTLTNNTAVPQLVTFTITPTANGCSGPTITATVLVNPTPSANQQPNQVVCNGAATAPIHFTGPVPGTIYNWTNDTPAIGLAPAGTGDIASFIATNNTNAPLVATITVTPVANGCPGPTMTFTITVNPTPVVNQPANQVVCNNTATAAVIFTSPTTGGTIVYNWTHTGAQIGQGPDGVGNIPSFTAINNTGAPVVATFTVIATYTNGGVSCVSQPVSFTITVNPTPVANQQANQTVCNNTATAAVNFTGNVAGAVYNWTNSAPSIGLAASGTGNIPSFTATNVTGAPVVATIVVTPTYTNAGVTCTGPTMTFTITVNPTPTVNAVASQVVCNGAPTTAVVFTGNAAGTVYNWTNNNTSIGLAASGTGNIASFTAINNGTTAVVATITVTPTYTNNGVTCTGTPITFTITVNPTPTVNAVASQTVCKGATTAAINFTGAIAGTVFNWTNNNTAIGLAASGTGNIAAFTAANPTSSPITATITVTPTANGCAGTPITFTITVNPTPAVNAVANQTLCAGASTIAVNFTSLTAGTTFAWTNNTPSIGLAASGTGNIASFVAVNAGTTPVTATITVTPSANGCTGAPITFTITVNPKANVAPVANQTLCNGSPTTAITFTGTVAGTIFNWTNSNTAIGLAATGQGNIPSFTATNNTAAPITATITVTPTTGSACAGTAISFTITVNPTPTVNAIANQALCEGGTTTAINFSGATTGTVFTWTNSNTGIGLAASGTGNISPFVVTNGTGSTIVATITVTGAANGCTSAVRTFTITVFAGVNNIVITNAPQQVCLTDTLITLAATPAGGTWSGRGVSGNTFNAALAGVGTTTLVYTLGNGTCLGSASVNVTVRDCIERHNVFANAIHIYPNPNGGQFNIRYLSDVYHAFGVRIIDADGHLIHTYSFANLVYGSVIPFDLRSLPSGTYFLEVFNDFEKAAFRVVIMK